MRSVEYVAVWHITPRDKGHARSLLIKRHFILFACCPSTLPIAHYRRYDIVVALCREYSCYSKLSGISCQDGIMIRLYWLTTA